MLDANVLNQAVERMVASATRPLKVILFGSFARGDADEGSDVDLLVVERGQEDKANEYLRLKQAIGRIGVGVDLLVYTEDEFEMRSQVPGTVAYWARHEGKVLHDGAA